MIFESHETVRWNRTLWICFAWMRMADVWPTGPFSVFPPFPRLFCLASPESGYGFGQLPSYLLLHSNCHRRPQIAQPCLVSHLSLRKKKTLQHPAPWMQCLSPLTRSPKNMNSILRFIYIFTWYLSKNESQGWKISHMLYCINCGAKNHSNWLVMVSNHLLLVISPYMCPAIVFVQELLHHLGHCGPQGCVSVRPPPQTYELSCCQPDWSVEIET